MELPFLKNKQKNQGGGAAIERVASPTHEDSMDDSLMDQVADELMSAIERKDHKGLREALKALVLHIQDEDEKQDQEQMS